LLPLTKHGQVLFVLLFTFAATIAKSQTLDFTFETKNNLFCASSKGDLQAGIYG
jgi:hypothetical protein